MRRLLLATAILAALAVAAVLFVAAQPREERVVDELGEVHEVIKAAGFAIVKHGPSRYQHSNESYIKYLKGRAESWDRWKKLVDKYGDEVYQAYVVPCRLLTPEEFLEMAKGLPGRVVKINSYAFVNGTWYDSGSAKVNENLTEAVERARKDREFIYSVLNITGDVEVYIAAFVLEAPLRELYALSKKGDLAMVDVPLDIIWRLREQGYRVVVERVAYGEVPLTKRLDLCQWVKDA